MAVTKTGNVVHMTATSDALAGTVVLRELVCDAATTLTDTAGNVVFKSGGGVSMTFGDGLLLQGLVFSVGTTVTLYV